jgi:hypothetical protein
MADTTAAPEPADGPMLHRIVRRSGGTGVLDLLAGLPGADLTSLLLEATRRRAGRLRPPDVLRRYDLDRFVVPAPIPLRQLRRAEDALLSALPPEVELLTLSPVVPLGTHSVLGTVNQNKVVSTIRAGEVAADPTNGLALAAAVRRRQAMAADPRSAAEVRLGTIQRVVRGQQFAGALAHFTLLGLVSAGRDTGDLAFERRHPAEHLRWLTGGIRAAGGQGIEVRLTALEPRFGPVLAAIRADLADRPEVRVVEDPQRQSGRGYYTGLCFKLFATVGGEPFEVGDGGLVDWTQRLLGNRKERLTISGIGVDRLSLA